jgi:glutathione synthase/RimK-type ligase-like ATP-grasp enzyme
MTRSGWLGLATCGDFPALTPDEHPLLAALRNAGVDARPVIWDDPDIAWTEAAAVIIRSCWDYHRAPDRFMQWLDSLAGAGVPVHNPVAVMRGNLDKRYLFDLQRQGCAIVPSVAVVAGEPDDLGGLLVSQGWNEAVIKPLVSGGAYQTWRLSRAEAADFQDRFATIAMGTGALVQPFAAEIVREGEWSLVCLDGRLSHVVNKRPKAGDFRVQDIHGGTLTAHPADERWQAVAAPILATLPDGLLYARLDGLWRDGRFLIMEVELIEPNLYLGAVPTALPRFVAAILARLDHRP